MGGGTELVFIINIYDNHYCCSGCFRENALKQYQPHSTSMKRSNNISSVHTVFVDDHARREY